MTKAEKYRFGVRRVREDDVPAIHELARESADQIYPWMSWCHPEISLAEILSWYRGQEEQWQHDDGYSFVIVEREGGRVAGGIGLRQINRSDQVASLYYWVGTRFIGYGAASTAIRQVGAYAFDLLDLVRLEIVTSVENQPGQKAAMKAGAQFEGRLRKRILLHGRSHDALLYSLVAEDLANLPGS